MTRFACFCAVVLMVSTAGAQIDLFLTRGPDDGSVPGMKGPDTFDPASKNFLPSYVAWFGSPQHSPFEQELGRREIYYLWAEMTLPSKSATMQIYAIDLRGSGVKRGAVLEDGLMYRQNKPAPNAYKRWDNGVKIPLPGLAAAVTARGVEAPANSGDLATDYQNKTYALLGAIRLSGNDVGVFQLGLGSSTLAVRIKDPNDPNHPEWDYDGSANNRYPFLTIQGKDAYKGPYDAVTIIPEPAALLILSLGAACLRRR